VSKNSSSPDRPPLKTTSYPFPNLPLLSKLISAEKISLFLHFIIALPFKSPNTSSFKTSI